jgi:hypothetical protein
MKILVLTLTLVALLVAISFAGMMYLKSKQMETPQVTPIEPTATTTNEEYSAAKKILTATMDISNLSPEEQSQVLASVDNQLADDDRLHTMAVAAGTEVTESAMFQAWQRQIYAHTDEAGLQAHIASLGMDEATYRANLERNLLVNTFLENKVKASITDEAIATHYENIPVGERDEFELMKHEISETLLTEAMIRVRTELLAS